MTPMRHWMILLILASSFVALGTLLAFVFAGAGLPVGVVVGGFFAVCGLVMAPFAKLIRDEELGSGPTASSAPLLPVMPGPLPVPSPPPPWTPDQVATELARI